jgi:hypothetical protein
MYVIKMYDLEKVFSVYSLETVTILPSFGIL